MAQASAYDRPFVLHVRVVTGAGGGPDKTVLNSPRYLRPLGYDAVCAFLHPPGDPGVEILRQRADRWDAPTEMIPDRGPLDFESTLHLLNLCRRRRVSIWHGHDYKSNAIGLLLRRFHPMKLVTTVHGWVRHTKRTKLY
ncbi:MAG: glycosyltransferase, partial [Planctomycetia bacterium]